MESVVKVQGAALRAPRGQMLGGGPQAMSMCIVEGRQQRRWPRAAATRRELSRATFAEPTYPRDTVLTIEYAQPHGSCWALPSSVCPRLHGPECGLRFRCSSSTIHTGIAFVVAPCARLTSTARSRSSLVPER